MVKFIVTFLFALAAGIVNFTCFLVIRAEPGLLIPYSILAVGFTGICSFLSIVVNRN